MNRIRPEPAAARLLRLCGGVPDLAVVLGSGFPDNTLGLEDPAPLPFDRLPGFASARVGGHSGQVVAGRLHGSRILLLCGRCHYYEGHPMATVTFPMRVLAALGTRSVLLTNAAGAIHPRYRPGDFMLLTDHINLMGVNPLWGSRATDPSRFLDLSRVYDPDLGRQLVRAARIAGARLHRGVYVAVSGPTYETPAEIRAFARLGADAVGMSTVPEAIVARQCGMRVAGLSCLTNPAAGRSRRLLSHTEVLSVARRSRKLSGALLREFVRLHAQNADR